MISLNVFFLVLLICL